MNGNPEVPEGRGADRRAIPQRSTRWATRIADLLARTGLTPNKISVLSLVFAVVAAVALLGTVTTSPGLRALLLAIAMCAIPLRLLCNMLDGMLAVEHGLHSPAGDLFNEVPDRIADVLVLAAAGYAAAGLWMVGGHDGGVALGWSAATLALLTAYVRALGAANGVGNFFAGPMAKPHRMWVIVAACAVTLLEAPLGWPQGIVLLVALAVVAVGSVVTVILRLGLIVRALRGASS